MQKDKIQMPDAYIVTCSAPRGDTATIHISVRAVKNNLRVCHFCPLKKVCTSKSRRSEATKLKFHDDLRAHNMHTPIVKRISRVV